MLERRRPARANTRMLCPRLHAPYLLKNGFRGSMKDRRQFFRNVLTGALGVSAASALTGAQNAPQLPVATPDIPNLEFSTDNGTKVFHLIAEPVKRQVAPNKTLDL